MLRLLLSLFLILPLYANIDTRIEAIQNASIEERFKLMNIFKKEMVQMKEEERMDAITKLKAITRSQHSNRALKELEKHARPTSTQRREMISKTKERTEVHSEHEAEAEDQMKSETEDHAENATEEQIENEMEDHIEDETEDHIEDEHDNDIDD